MLLLGEPGVGKAQCASDVVASAAAAGVACVWAASRPPPPALRGACVVVCPPRASPGVAFVSMCAAFAVAEGVRDAGGDALLVLDDARCAVDLWTAATLLLPAQVPHAGDDMVAFEGMLIAASSAERRAFFSSVLQRAARLAPDHGGGSLTLLALLPSRVGAYAFGAGRAASGRARTDVARRSGAAYATLSPQLKAKLLAALHAEDEREALQAAQSGEGVARQARALSHAATAASPPPVGRRLWRSS